MITCTVHEREDSEGDIATQAGRIAFVREGIAWWALFFPLIWIIYHRLWLVLMLYLAAIFVIGGLAEAADIPEIVGGLVTMAISLLLALEGNDLRRWTLRRRGYRLVDVTCGRDLQECEQRFFENWLAGQSERKDMPPPVPQRTPPGASKSQPSAPSGEDVIGLFPEPGR